jgi:hypothetical protein
LVDPSLVIVIKEMWAIKKWKHEGPSIKKRKTKGWRHEGPRKRRRIYPCSQKEIYIGREIIQQEFPFHPPLIIHCIHTRAHLDLIV